MIEKYVRKLEEENKSLINLCANNYKEIEKLNKILDELEEWGKKNFYIDGDEVAFQVKKLRSKYDCNR